MNKPIAFVLASIVTLFACNKEDPRPSVMQEDLMLQRATFKISPDDWEAYGIPGDDTHGYTASANVQMISQAIVTGGVVNVYLQRSNGGWLPLPVTIAQGGPQGNNWNFTYSTGKVNVRIDRNGDGVKPPDEPLTFRVTAGMQ